MSVFKFWKEYYHDLSPNSVTSVNPKVNTANIVKIMNEDANGSVVFASTQSKVSNSYYEIKIDKGGQNSIVKPEALGTVYLFNPSGSKVRVRIVEIETNDISYMFNATNQVQLSGSITTDGIKASDLNLDGTRDLQVDVKTLPDPVTHEEKGWIVTASGDNVIATASKAGVAGASHYITSVFAGYTAGAVGVATIKQGTTILGEYPIHNAGSVALPSPIQIASGSAVSVELSASGTAGILGKVNLVGYSA